MLIYFCVYIISILFIHLASKRRMMGRDVRFFVLLSIVAPLFLASVRDVRVGRDVFVYQIRIFELALKSANPIKYIMSISDINEIGYKLFVFLVSRFFRDIHFLFFFEELLVLVLVYYALWQYSDKVPIEYSLMIYFLLSYLNSYCAIKQEIAMALFLVATTYMVKYDIKRMMFFMALSFTFHVSAVITIPIVILYFYMKVRRNNIGRNLVLVLLCGAIMYVSTNYKTIAIWIINLIPFFPQRWIRNIETNKNNFQSIEFVICLVVILILILARRIDKKNTQWIEWLILLNIIHLFGCFFTAKVDFGGRLYMYFKYFWMLALGEGFLLFKKDVLNKMIYTVTTATLFGIWSVYLYKISDVAGVVPYVLM